MKALVKVGPIIVILACAASLYFSNKLDGIRQGLEGDKKRLTSDLSQTQDKLQDTKTALADTEDDLTTTKNELSATKAKLGAAEVKIAQKEREVEDVNTSKGQLEQQLENTKQQLAKAAQDTRELREKIDSVEFQETEDLAKKVNALTEENELIGKQLASAKEANTKLEDEVRRLKETPPGTRGHVALTEPDWNLVVLDIGKEDLVHEQTEFLLYRDDKLIAKVRVTSVNEKNSVAELVDGFTLDTPREGDLAVLAKTEKM